MTEVALTPSRVTALAWRVVRLPVGATVLGASLALMVLVGRFGLGRLLGGSDRLVLTQGRVLLLLPAAVGVLLVTASGQRDHNDRAVQWQVSLTLVLLGYLATSALWSPFADPAMLKSLDLVLIGLGMMALGQAVRGRSTEAFVDAFWVVILAGTSFLALVGVLSVLGGGDRRLAVLGGGPNVFGRLMGLMVICWCAQLARGRSLVIVALPIAAGLMLVLLSGSRGAMVATICGVAVVLAVGRVPVRKVATLAVGYAVAAASGLIGSGLLDRLGGIITNRIVRLVLSGQVYTAGRDELYPVAVRMGLDAPLLGEGVGGFWAADEVYPHNLFLEVFSEGGLIALVVTLLVLAQPCLAALKVRGSRGSVAAGAFALALVGSQFSGDLYDSRGIFLFGALLVWELDRGRQAHPRIAA